MSDLALNATTRSAFAIPLRAAPAYALAVLSGVGYFLGFPGMNLWPLAFVSQVPLIVALHGQTPRRAAGLGLVAGFTMTALGFSWLLDMLAVFSGFPLVACAGIMVLMCLQQGGRGALLGWLHARAEARGWPGAVVFALAFVASELVYPLIFPWYFGASVHNARVFLQVADLGGPYLIALVLLGSNLAVAEVVLARIEKRAVSRRLIAVGFAVPIAGAAYGAVQLRRIDAQAAEAPAIRIGIAQGNQPLIGRRHAMETHLRLTEELRQKGAELVVWSEGAVPSVFPEAKFREEARDALGSKLGVPAILGVAIRRKASPGKRGTLFNTALLTDADGTVLGRYDKQYLLAFGEYVPFGDIFPILYRWSPNSGRFAKGTTIEPMPFGEHRISALICYEDILPSFVNGIVRHADPDLLVNLTNDAWFGNTSEPWEHLALAQLRAVEHRRYLVRATNTGVSAIVDATGRVVLRGDMFTEQALVGTARFMRRRTVYEIAGDAPFYACAIAVCGMAFVRRRRAAVTASTPS